MQGNAIPNVLFIYNDEYSCLCLDANNNEWMDFFVFLVLNLLVKIQFVADFTTNFYYYNVFHLHMLILPGLLLLL